MHAIEEINVLSGKMDELMKLFANKSVSSDPNDMPFSTLIENNNESMDVNFVGRNNFGNNAYRGNFISRPYPSNPSNNYGNSYINSYGNYNKIPSQLVGIFHYRTWLVYSNDGLPQIALGLHEQASWMHTHLVSF